ncbi:MAG: hypothetical protein EOO42_21315, partial [Flavobacteriales bacterium]
MKKFLFYLMVFVLCFQFSLAQVQTLNIKDSGYRSIWYSNEPSKDEYVYKYSGGLGTYPANHYPFSLYVAKV